MRDCTCAACGRDAHDQDTDDPLSGFAVFDTKAGKLYCHACYEKAHPIRWYEKTWWGSRRVWGKVWWWLLYRLHPSHRYHVVRTGLRPGWHDRDLVLGAVIVQVFKDFVEREKPFEQFVTEEGPYQKEWARVKELYAYFSSKPFPELDDEAHELGGYDELDDKLCELVRLRHFFWT